jgi:hypothetical protein
MNKQDARKQLEEMIKDMERCLQIYANPDYWDVDNSPRGPNVKPIEYYNWREARDILRKWKFIK